MGMSSKDKPGIPLKGVKKWYGEIKDFANTVGSYVFNEATGHFTQLVWAATTDVGCGWVKWHEGKWYRKMMICNYGSAGNQIGSPIYNEGDACSACPAGTACKDSLCA